MQSKPVYVVDGARSPFLKARNKPGPFSASDLAVQTGQQLILRQPFAATDINEVIIGCAAPAPNETNIARIIALRLGCGHNVPAYTVMRNCASGMQALDNAIMSIRSGRHNLVLAGGTEAMSRAPILISQQYLNWLTHFNESKSVLEKLKLVFRLRPSFLRPEPALLKGLTDPVVGLSMGQTAENLAHMFNIKRSHMDAFAARSHVLAKRAHERHIFDNELIPITDAKGRLYNYDDGIRSDSTPGNLAKLKAVFDKPWGNITAGNSSQVTDGAALLILASEEAVNKYKLQPLGKIIDTQWAALDPAIMGLGPVMASSPILIRQNLGLNNIDIWEINEAFAAQVLSCLEAWNNEEWCQTNLGHSAFGELDIDSLNVDGGAIAIGHPVGASGARIVLHCLNTLKDRSLKTGMATICIGGGQGGAMLLEASGA